MKEQGFGLIVKRRHIRNFSRAKYFGAGVNLSEIPLDFDLEPSAPILNQTSSTCTAFSNASASALQEGVPQSPEYAFYKTRVIQGGDPHTWGANQYDALKAWTKFGGIEPKDSPYKFEEKGQYFIEDPKNWESIREELDKRAAMHKKESYLEVDGYGNLFDSIRAALWDSYLTYNATKNISLKRAVIAGVYWQPDWQSITSKAPDSINKNLAHQVIFRGCKNVNGEPYLICQNSWGADRGDKGLYYFSKEVVNSKAFIFAFQFADVDPEELKKAQWTLLQLMTDYLVLLSKWIKVLFKTEKEELPLPDPPPDLPPDPPKNRLEDWALAIKALENAPAEWNNPGAIKGLDGKFLKFKTYESGWLYLLDYLVRAATGSHKAYFKSGETTLLEFCEIYAPYTDKNDPLAYSFFISQKLGVPNSIKIKELV